SLTKRRSAPGDDNGFKLSTPSESGGNNSYGEKRSPTESQNESVAMDKDDDALSSRRLGVVQATLLERGMYHSQRALSPLLDTINYPIHMKNLLIKVNLS
ncbi:hypothetical protein M8C21_018266, partial [Ambrosia artemisiifolia]